MSQQPSESAALPFTARAATEQLTRYLGPVGRFMIHKRLGAFGVIVVAFFLFLWVGQPLVQRYDPREVFQGDNPDYNPNATVQELQKDPDLGSPIVLESLEGPSSRHWFGTDKFGRDIYSRTIAGVELAMIIGLVASAIATGGSIILGVASGYYGGKFDLILQRIIDAMMAFPALVFLLLLVQVAEPSTRNSVLALGVLGLPTGTRLIRSATLSVRETEYITAARLVGAGDLRVMFRHVLPNVGAVAIISFTVLIGGYILAEASLSFLGLGPQGVISWGRMVNDGRVAIQLHPWESLFSGLAITMVVIAFNFFGDALRDVLDPRLRGA